MDKKTLLLIGSSQDLTDVSKRILERDGYSVHCAGTADEVWQRMSGVSPDGIVLLNDLYKVDGICLCRELRKAYTAPILFTSNCKDDELRALQAGANDYMKKPFDYQILRARISVMLNTKVGALTGENEENPTHGSAAKDGENARPIAKTHDFPGASPWAGRDTARGISSRLPYIVAAACLILVLIIAGIFMALNESPIFTNIPEGPIPMAESPMPDAS